MKERQIPENVLQRIIAQKFAEWSKPENSEMRASGREEVVKKVLTEIVYEIAQETGVVIIIPEK